MESLKIVILDGYCLNPGDLSFKGLQELGDVAVFDRTAPEEVLGRAEGAQILLTNKTILSAETISQLNHLQYIGILATGYNVVDIEAAKARHIPVCNVPAYGTASVAQMVFAHLLNLTQRVSHHAQTVREGRWSACPDFCYWDFPLVELSGLIMGIFGFGAIGRATARIAHALQMQVLATNRRVPSDIPAYVQMVPSDELFRRSDVVSLHCPLTPETDKIIDRRTLSLMKNSAYLINTARGQLIDEAALAEALNEGSLMGAGLDGLSEEPPKADHPLFTAKNCYITPHIAWASRATRSRLLEIVIDNIKGFLAGNPRNVVY